MCRWLAYVGQPIYIEKLVTKPVHSLVRQSIDAEMYYGQDGSLWSLNADGSGVGWYGDHEEPGLFRDSMPAWSNTNLHELCAQVKARIMLAHVRATTTGTVQNTNCHPFKYKNWLFQHNGHISGFDVIKQDVHQEIGAEFYHNMKGTTDSEAFFHLALTYGLQDNPKQALQKMVETLIDISKDNRTDGDLNLSCALSDGDKVYTLRFATQHDPNSQFYSTNPDQFAEYDCEATEIPNDSVLVVSEPLDRLSGKWQEVPKNSFVTIDNQEIDVQGFL